MSPPSLPPSLSVVFAAHSAGFPPIHTHREASLTVKTRNENACLYPARSDVVLAPDLRLLTPPSRKKGAHCLPLLSSYPLPLRTCAGLRVLADVLRAPRDPLNRDAAGPPRAVRPAHRRLLPGPSPVLSAPGALAGSLPSEGSLPAFSSPPCSTERTVPSPSHCFFNSAHNARHRQCPRCVSVAPAAGTRRPTASAWGHTDHRPALPAFQRPGGLRGLPRFWTPGPRVACRPAWALSGSPEGNSRLLAVHLGGQQTPALGVGG